LRVTSDIVIDASLKIRTKLNALFRSYNIALRRARAHHLTSTSPLGRVRKTYVVEIVRGDLSEIEATRKAG
jgi:hypothetical protein